MNLDNKKSSSYKGVYFLSTVASEFVYSYIWASLSVLTLTVQQIFPLLKHSGEDKRGMAGN